MVYRSQSERRAEQERAPLERDWMTLSEGIELIKHVDAESKVEVKQLPYEQICDAIEEGELRARWLEEIPPPRGPSPLWAVPPDKPKYFVGELRRRKVRFQNGGEIHWGGRRWRKLLLSREDMQRLFGGMGSATSSIKKFLPLSNNPQGIEVMHEAISAVYELAQEQRVRPPNLREIIKPVQRWLEKHRGVSAKGSWIAELAADERYNSRRGKPGVKVKGRLRPVSELQI
jgi:hypothetical protein